MMPVQTIETQVDGHQLQIVQFPAGRGIKLQARVGKLILPVLGSILGESFKGGNISGKDLKGLLDANVDVSKALSVLAESVDEDRLYQLVLDLLSSTKVDGSDFVTAKIFDEIFTANYTLAYKVAFAVVKANGFFDLSGIGLPQSSGNPSTLGK
jgi:hypothetical protein